MRALARIGILTLLVADLGSSVAAATATSAKLQELPETYVSSGLPAPAPRQVGSLTPLRAGVTYLAKADRILDSLRFPRKPGG